MNNDPVEYWLAIINRYLAVIGQTVDMAIDPIELDLAGLARNRAAHQSDLAMQVCQNAENLALKLAGREAISAQPLSVHLAGSDVNHERSQVMKFIDERTELSENAMLSTDRLYSAYVSWAKVHNEYIGPKVWFAKQLMRLRDIHGMRKVKVMGDVHHWIGRSLLPVQESVA